MGPDLLVLFIYGGMIIAAIGGIAAIREAVWGGDAALIGTLATILGIVAVVMS